MKPSKFELKYFQCQYSSRLLNSRDTCKKSMRGLILFETLESFRGKTTLTSDWTLVIFPENGRSYSQFANFPEQGVGGGGGINAT